MKKTIAILVLLVGINFTVPAQETKIVALEQTAGEFTQKAITLSEGTYIFEIANVGVNHEVGFVLAPKGKTDAEHHIKNAYVVKTVATNTTGHSKEVILKKGE